MAEKVPRLLPGAHIKKMKLDAMDGYVLSRINGKTTPKDLSMETGIPDFSVVRILEKLDTWGVIEICHPNPPPPGPPKPPEPPKARFDGSALPPKYDLKELEDECDL